MTLASSSGRLGPLHPERSAGTAMRRSDRTTLEHAAPTREAMGREPDHVARAPGSARGTAHRAHRPHGLGRAPHRDLARARRGRQRDHMGVRDAARFGRFLYHEHETFRDPELRDHFREHRPRRSARSRRQPFRPRQHRNRAAPRLGPRRRARVRRYRPGARRRPLSRERCPRRDRRNQPASVPRHVPVAARRRAVHTPGKPAVLGRVRAGSGRPTTGVGSRIGTVGCRRHERATVREASVPTPRSV